MNSPQVGLRVASIIFGLGCLMHVLRLIQSVDVKIGPYVVSLWMSVVGALVLGALSAWMWWLGSTAAKAAATHTPEPPHTAQPAHS